MILLRQANGFGSQKARNMSTRCTFVLGGARSGKSAFAERLVESAGKPKIYIATAQAFDTEMRARIEAHKGRRGEGWTTTEAPLDVAGALGTIPAGSVVLLDCATLWLSNHLLAEHDLSAACDGLIAALADCRSEVVVVSNEVGSGIVPENPLARRFRDAQGVLNQRLAAICDLAVLVVAGLPVVLKGTLPKGLP